MAEKTVPATREASTPTATRDDERFVTPPVDIYETREALVVVADLPGVDRRGLEVKVIDGVLTIQGRTSHEMPGTPIIREFGLATFFRQFELSEHIDQQKIHAELSNGVLTVRLPKAETAKPKRIEVKVG